MFAEKARVEITIFHILGRLTRFYKIPFCREPLCEKKLATMPRLPFPPSFLPTIPIIIVIIARHQKSLGARGSVLHKSERSAAIERKVQHVLASIEIEAAQGREDEGQVRAVGRTARGAEAGQGTC